MNNNNAIPPTLQIVPPSIGNERSITPQIEVSIGFLNTSLRPTVGDIPLPVNAGGNDGPLRVPAPIEPSPQQVGDLEGGQGQVPSQGLATVRVLLIPKKKELKESALMGMTYLGASIGAGYLRPIAGQNKINDSTLAVAAFLSVTFGLCSRVVLNSNSRLRMEDCGKNLWVGFFKKASHVVGQCPNSLQQLFVLQGLPSFMMNQEGIKFIKKLTVATLCVPLFLIEIFIPIATPMALIALSTDCAQRIQGEDVDDFKLNFLTLALSLPLGCKHLCDFIQPRREPTP